MTEDNKTFASPFLQLVGIKKSFGSLIANDHIDFDIDRGEVHALLGENGSGKTTLMNTLYGLYKPDSGMILINGQPVSILSPRDALNHRIGMVHQHFMLIPNLSVTENIILGLDNGGKLLLDLRSATARVRDLGKQYGLEVDPSARVSDLPVGIQQRVEILKALFRGVELLILDEPTAVLTPLEVRDFFLMLKRLVENGLSSIFISHKLDEVLEISQRITVLNRGKKIGTLFTKDATQQQLADMMVGRSVNLRADRKPHQKDGLALSVSHLSKMNIDGLPVLKDVSFDVSAGEIFGIAGVDGNGQQELIDTLIGLTRPDSGSVELNGMAITGKSPKQIINSGVSCVPADRQRMGAVMELAVSDNLIMKRSDAQPYARHGILDKKAIRNISEKIIRQYDIRTMGPEAVFSSLSGGNQQKVVLAREIESSPKLLIVCYPTRGLDIGATEYVHSCILEQREKNVAVILVSSELEEVMSLSDRIAVFFRGEIMGILDNNTQPQLDTIGKMMLGESLEALNEA